MAEISWGKCNLMIGMYESQGGDITKGLGPFVKLATPVNGSTTVNIDEGEKHEAEIEGGGNEAVRYDEDKMSIEFDVRRAAGRPAIGTGAAKLGQIACEWALALQPENASAPGIVVERCSIKRVISYSSADGIYDHYKADALVPTIGDAVKLGVVSVAQWPSSGGKHTKGDVVLATSAKGQEGTKYQITFDEDDGVIDMT